MCLLKSKCRTFFSGCIKGGIGESRFVLEGEASVGGRWCSVFLPFGGSTTTATKGELNNTCTPSGWSQLTPHTILHPDNLHELVDKATYLQNEIDVHERNTSTSNAASVHGVQPRLDSVLKFAEHELILISMTQPMAPTQHTQSQLT